MDDNTGQVTIEGLEEKIIQCPDEVFQCIEVGKKYRHVGKTDMNEHSSRSHTIFRIIIESSGIVKSTSPEKSPEGFQEEVINSLNY